MAKIWLTFILAIFLFQPNSFAKKYNKSPSRNIAAADTGVNTQTLSMRPELNIYSTGQVLLMSNGEADAATIFNLIKDKTDLKTTGDYNEYKVFGNVKCLVRNERAVICSIEALPTN